jgi:hypothetical protein
MQQPIRPPKPKQYMEVRMDGVCWCMLVYGGVVYVPYNSTD